MQQRRDIIIRKGAEADIYIRNWYGKIAISKTRSPKPYRNKVLDARIRRVRTIHEARFISHSKIAGLNSPFVYYVDWLNAEIIMQFIEGHNGKDMISSELCSRMGDCAALLHRHHIIHGDLTTSNFIIAKGNLFLIDYGLSYYSQRVEDRATDIRLIKQVLDSVHGGADEKLYESFLKGYSTTAGNRETEKILRQLSEVESRGRYSGDAKSLETGQYLST
ncbi:MAG TPA: KEOPS complex kinase/ATPase Bud32 [Nitrososphaeraceae archaeon]|nr:KEOPS complex kinase/ATPase Bud32 [Nitrososphaeraceae archaeon]